ncbi:MULTISPECIES: VOC family protein [unclassified Sphingobium]|uniref:VOC family protein n=1 Tax=unclassified Sphingobium TaxID=2611147 RepID=UPI002224FA80|nr:MULTISPECIES: VOC family protein [unclassified Sphingobium]MCW2396104.1 putative enzyme related to lactoylglutathione lyase [Sphingobium sp. B8D3B]MCW2419620.1 putative enzyme related to lactoylglutathione lyase [Sphingobium sp. B8D3C]
MTNRHGEFIWYELMTSDLEAARAFYGAVVGWSIAERSDMPGMDYRMIRAADGEVGGMMALDAEMIAGGGRRIWIGYIGVDDVDATAAAIPSMGGRLYVQPQDIPGVGRFAMAADPHGAPFYIMRGSVEGGVSRAFSPQAVGHCGWNELSSPDQPAALAFYTGLFGWSSPSVMPMGPMGDYRFLSVGDLPIGASLEQKDQRAEWRFYFRLPSIRAAMEAVAAHGGTITTGPHEVPGGDWVVMGTDPQGARFALVGGR